MKRSKKAVAWMAAIVLAVSMTACGSSSEEETTAAETTTAETTASEMTAAETTTEEETTAAAAYTELTADDIATADSLESVNDSEHVLEIDGEEYELTATEVVKSGDSAAGDKADFYGDNAAVFATNGATLYVSGSVFYTNGKHANAIFSYGEGTTVNVSDTLIETDGNCSGGLMTTGGGTTNAENVTIHTTGNSSAAVRSDRGGGIVTVSNSYLTTDGVGSPVVYSTADITINDSFMESTASQGVVVEGKNSVTLNNCDLTAANTTKNGSHSEYYQAVMIYQSMSGDAAQGMSSFAMNGGTLSNQVGDIFFVTNTNCEITLTDVEITNNDADGIFLRASAAGWGSDGYNGGHASLTAASQTIEGDILVDAVSALNLYLTSGSSFTGAVNTDGQEGEVYVEIGSGSVWTLTGDSYITGLTCGADAIDLNGYTLYVNGEVYSEGTAQEGEAIDMTAYSSSGNGDGHGGHGGGEPPAKP